MPAGTPAYAVARGVVTFAREHGTCATNWGELTILEVATVDGHTHSFLYGHCRAVVAEGDIVELGQHLCDVMDYRSSGPCVGWWSNHLHFGVYEGVGECGISRIGEYPCWAAGYVPESDWPGSYVDPVAFLREYAVTPSRHPPGALVQMPDHSDSTLRSHIYQVCGDGELCWVTTEDNFLSRRLYHSSGEPWALVVPITEDEFNCYQTGHNIDYPLTMRFTRCNEWSADRLRRVERTYLTVNDHGVLGRWRVPFAPDEDSYGILLRSWGFGTEEVLSEYEGCGYPLQTDLALRDGTLVELASDNDFYVVSNGGYAYRLMRGLAWALHYSSGQILQLPDGSLPALIRGIHHDHPNFSVVDATQCAAIVPSGGPGGGAVDSDAGALMSVDAGMPPGAMDAGSACVAGAPELCNGFDDNCDGVTDEGYDLDWDGANCGRCGNDCARPHTAPACVRGICIIEACNGGWADADGNFDNGCECAVFPEFCNGMDDDCDGLVDEGGVCTPASMDAGVPVLPDAGTDAGPPTCIPGTETCNYTDDDCDGVVDDGFDLLSDSRNCGLCGLLCPSGWYCFGGTCASPPTDAGVPTGPDAGTSRDAGSDAGSGLRTVRVRFCPGVDGSLTSGLPDRHDMPPYRYPISATSCGEYSFGLVAPGTYRINAEYPTAPTTWECNEWPAGSIWLRHGTPEVWVDGVPTPVTCGHDPTISGGTGGNFFLEVR